MAASSVMEREIRENGITFITPNVFNKNHGCTSGVSIPSKGSAAAPVRDENSFHSDNLSKRSSSKSVGYNGRWNTLDTNKIDGNIMLGLSATYNYFLFNGSVDLRKGCFSLAEVIREEMHDNPINGDNVYIFMAKNRKVVKILHYERGFFVLYEKRPLTGKFKKPLFDENTKKYKISWSDMVCLTESVVITSMSFSKVV